MLCSFIRTQTDFGNHEHELGVINHCTYNTPSKPHVSLHGPDNLSVICLFTFKNRLDRLWQNQEIIYDFKAQLEGTGSRSNL